MYVMVTGDILIVTCQVLLLNLKGRVVYPQLPALIRQLGQHSPLHALSRQHVRNENGLPRLEIPHVDIMHIDHPLQLLTLALQLSHINTGRRSLHDEQRGKHVYV